MPETPPTSFTVEGCVELFDRPGGWYYIRIPARLSGELAALADRGVIAISAEVGVSSWDTSLLPMGDGGHFVALNKSVRERNNLNLGDRLSLGFSPRQR